MRTKFYAGVLILTAVLGTNFTGVLCAAEAPKSPEENPIRALGQEMKAFQEKEMAFRQSKQQEMSQIETQMTELKKKNEGADEATKKKLWGQFQPLQKRRGDIMEEVMKYEVTAAEQSLSFAQRRLVLTKENLAQFQARRKEMEEKMALMKDKIA